MIGKLKKKDYVLYAKGYVPRGGGGGAQTLASRGIIQQSYPLPTVAGMVTSVSVALINLITARSPWLQLRC